MPRRTKEDAEKTRQAILDSALDLFSERGIASVSLAQVAAAAGVTRGAVYWHFSGKDQILEELWERVYPMHLPQPSVSPAEADYLAPIAALVEGFLVALARDEQLQKLLLLTSQSRTDPKIAPAVKQLSSRELQELADYLEQGRGSGQLRRDISAAGMALYIWGAVEGIADNWLYADSQIDLAGEASGMTAALLQGLYCD